MYKLQAFTKNMPIFCVVGQNQKLTQYNRPDGLLYCVYYSVSDNT